MTTQPDTEAENGSTVEGEVTRVKEVTYLQGATGHGVASLCFLAVAMGLLALGRWDSGVIATVVACGVALNGASIYAWDRLRERFASAVERDGDGPERTLTPPTISTEMKAELLAGFTMVGAVAVGIGLVLAGIRYLGVRDTAFLLVGALVVGNVVALLRAVATDRRQ